MTLGMLIPASNFWLEASCRRPWEVRSVIFARVRNLSAPGAPLFFEKSLAFVSHELNVISVDSTAPCHFVKARVTEV